MKRIKWSKRPRKAESRQKNHGTEASLSKSLVWWVVLFSLSWHFIIIKVTVSYVTYYEMLSMLGKEFQQRIVWNTFSYFSQKTEFDIWNWKHFAWNLKLCYCNHYLTVWCISKMSQSPNIEPDKQGNYRIFPKYSDTLTPYFICL